MKKLFNKFLAGAVTLALVATLAFGVSYVRNTKADGVMPIKSFQFKQGGQYNPSESGNEGYIGSVTMSSGETITGWKTGNGSKDQTQSFTGSANGYSVKINNTGWDAQWKVNTGFPVTTINPWAITTSVVTDMPQGHVMKVTFKARASKAKNAYVSFRTVKNGVEMNPYDEAPMRTDTPQIINLGLSDTTFTYIFDNYVNGETLTTNILLGAFTPDEDDGQFYDYAQKDCTSLVDPLDTSKWNGTVTISDLQVIDMGVNPDIPTDPPKPSTTKAPTPTVAPASTSLGKVTGVKVKSVKKKTIKVSWKKVANAKAYQVKVGNKTYKTSATSKKIKNKKFKKGKKVTVKVRATATGYTPGAWSKAVKKKLTK